MKTNVRLDEREEEQKKNTATIDAKSALSDFLDELGLDEKKNKKGGKFRLGEVWRHSDKSLGGILPILINENQLSKSEDGRGYVMMEELQAQFMIPPST